jgi:predicted aspartyl protease
LARAAIWTPGSSQVLRCVVCLDTGADSCVFPAAFAIQLGIDLLSLKNNVTGGVGSSGNVTYYTDLEIALGNGIQFKSFVGFTEAMDRLGMGLLGQSGFFEYYKVHFHHGQRTFAIETL